MLDIKSLEQDLKIKNKEDWYSISQMQIDEFGGATALRRYGGLEKVELHSPFFFLPLSLTSYFVGAPGSIPRTQLGFEKIGVDKKEESSEVVEGSFEPLVPRQKYSSSPTTYLYFILFELI